MAYQAIATREHGSRYWLVHIAEIDQVTQARHTGEIELMARELIAVCLDVPLDSVDVEVTIELPPSVREHLERADRLTDQADQYRAASAESRRAAARELKALGLTVRDIGRALGVSHQRAQQLVST